MERWEEYIKGVNGMIFSKTEEQFSDLLDELKTEFNWNDGQLYLLPPNSTLLR